MIKKWLQSAWLKAAIRRAVKTVAQAALGAIGGAAIVSEVNWEVVVSTAVLAGVSSLLMSTAGLPEIKLLNVAEGQK